MDFQAYSNRIGFTGKAAPDLATLNELHLLHPLAIPFENLSSFTGSGVSLDPAAVFDKLVHRGRGGYCFEQNLLFSTMLRDIGFEVTTHAARVVWMGTPKTEMPRTHKLLKVTIDGVDYIADVGFGGMTMTAPLRLVMDEIQPTPHENFRFTRDGDDYRLSAQLKDGWKDMYVFDLSTQLPIDFVLANYFVDTNPNSHFTHTLILAKPYKNGRHAFFNDTWTKYSKDGQKTEKRYTEPSGIINMLDEIFRVHLEGTIDRAVLEKRLESLLAGIREQSGQE